MIFRNFALQFAAVASLYLSANAVPLAQDDPPSPPCTNEPTSRNCWSEGFDIDTDYYERWPNTGRVVEYNWEITNQTLAPDGFERIVLAVNGQFPGPPIVANWGDTVVVHVTNKLTNNGTSIHWHGVRMLNSAEADGATAVTQCPIAPGHTYTYRWQATQYGHSWYHSHFSLQYSEGVVGPIVIHGPSTADWDIDVGPILLSDWFHKPAFELANEAFRASTGVPPVADNGLINGMNVYKGSGKRFSTVFQAGKKHLLRITNTGTDITFKFSIDGHRMKVIAMDWVPIEPYETNAIFVTIGQRYDVIVEANAAPKDYWMRAIPQLSCFSLNTQAYNIRGIVRYDGNSQNDPSTHSWDIRDKCADEDSKNLVPHLKLDVDEPQGGAEKGFEVGLAPVIGKPGKPPIVFQWTVNSNHYQPNSSAPTILEVERDVNVQLPKGYAVTELESVNQWVYFVIQSLLPIAHPFHLHGHDFFVLAKGFGRYDSLFFKPTLDLTNPPRRDVALLPAIGYLVIAFKTDNPGAWLMHCHIAWHLNMGLGLQILERRKEIAATIKEKDAVKGVCDRWKTYDKSDGGDGA